MFVYRIIGKRKLCERCVAWRVYNMRFPASPNTNKQVTLYVIKIWGTGFHSRREVGARGFGRGSRVHCICFCLSVLSGVIRQWFFVLKALPASGHVAYDTVCLVSLLFPLLWGPKKFAPEPEPAVGGPAGFRSLDSVYREGEREICNVRQANISLKA